MDRETPALSVEGSARSALSALAHAAAADAGEGSAVERLLQALAPSVRQTCRGALGSRHSDLEDAIQDSLIAILRALPAWRSEGDFIHYATKICLRVALSTRRRSARRLQTVELDDTGGKAHDEPPLTVGDAHIQAEHSELLRVLIRSLARDQAEVLLLRFMIGYSLEETAKITAVPVNTAKTRIRLAKNALRKKIAANPLAFQLFGGPRK